MDQKKRNTLLPLCFFLFLAAGALGLLFSPRQDYSEREKRYLAPAPDAGWDALLEGRTQRELEDWLSDHFPLRDFWVGVGAYLELAEGRNAQRAVYYGAEQHLFRAPARADGTQLVRNLERFDRFAEALDVPATLLAVPASGYINDALLPFGHGDYPDEAVYTAAAELRHVALLDPRDALAEANGTAEVYYRTDHHLTAWGSYALYSLLRQRRGLDAVPASAYAVTAYDGFCGTAWSAGGYWLVPPDSIELWDAGAPATVTVYDGNGEPEAHAGLFYPEHLEELDKYPAYLDGNHPLTEVENPEAEGGTLLILKDSYAHCLTAFLASDYRRIVMADLRYYRGSVSDLAREKGADELLLVYGTENLLTDTNSAWLR
ncbi:MAG: hypothetical protein IJU29_09070 [Oscillospiraceae bacterium]|nr:hypothetical protein [Oscillospiraceae bacterium]